MARPPMAATSWATATLEMVARPRWLSGTRKPSATLLSTPIWWRAWVRLGRVGGSISQISSTSGTARRYARPSDRSGGGGRRSGRRGRRWPGARRRCSAQNACRPTWTTVAPASSRAGRAGHGGGQVGALVVVAHDGQRALHAEVVGIAAGVGQGLAHLGDAGGQPVDALAHDRDPAPAEAHQPIEVGRAQRAGDPERARHRAAPAGASTRRRRTAPSRTRSSPASRTTAPGRRRACR